MRHLILILLATLLTTLLPAAADARIKLATQPVRERVEIQLENGRYTLVEEERIVPLLQSTATENNFVDFAWANTQIDKDSIQFRPIAIRTDDGERPIGEIDGKPEIQVVNVAYPPNENALVWEIYAANACAARVRVSYLIANLTRTFAYRALANPDETELVLKQYIQLRNYSGEDFGDAGVYAGFGPRFEKQVGEQEDIKMLLARFLRVPIRKTFSFDWYANGPLNPDKPYASRIAMHYVLTNDADHGLGQFPLQPGKARIFIEDGHGGEAFLGEDWAALTPLDDDLKLFLGEARDIVCTRTIKDNLRHKVQGQLFDQEIWIKYEIENFKDKAVVLDIREQLNRLAAEYGRPPHGDVEWTLGRDTSPGIEIDRSEGTALPRFSVSLPARPEDPNAPVEKTTVVLHVRLENLW
jgi:hypothetical protein